MLIKSIKLRNLGFYFATLFVISMVGFQILNSANNNSKAEFSDAIKITLDRYNPNFDLVIVPNALSYHAADYYSIILKANFRPKIYNPENNLVYYEGLSTLRNTDFYNGNFMAVERVWLMQLWGSSVPGYLEDYGFKIEEVFDIKGVEMSLWIRD